MYNVDYQVIKDLVDFTSPISLQTAMALQAAARIQTFKRGAFIESSGQYIKYQYIVMSGIIRKFLTNSKGEFFTVDFFRSGQAITPALLRSIDLVSFVNLEVISQEVTVMAFSILEMEKAMQNNNDLERMGIRVIMQDAFKRAEREKILLTATGLEKLAWFRKNYPGLENEVPHYYIASFLGMTPTSLSRCRKKIIE